MTEEQVSTVEARLGISLPPEYRAFLLADPQDLIGVRGDLEWKKESPAQRELYNDPARLIEYNEDARRDDGTPWTADDGPWPRQWLIIGDDQCGSHWCVDLEGAQPGVWFYDHDTGEWEPVALTLAEHVAAVLERIEEWNREQR